MPGINPPNDERFVYLIAEMRAQMRASATNQQLVISNLQGEPILAFGLQPGSNPAEYGLGLLSQAFGSNLAFFGEDASGNVGLKYFDSTGNLVRLDNAAGTTWYNTSGYVIRQETATGTYWYDGTTPNPTSANVTMSVTPANGFEVFDAGTLVSKTDSQGLHVYNASGVEEVAAGLLNASPAQYGLAVLPAVPGATAMVRVGGFVSVDPPNVTSATNTSYTAFPTPNSVTVDVGPSGLAAVTVQCDIATGGSDYEGLVGVQVDGGAWSTLLNASAGATGGLQIQTSSTYHFSGLSTGSHTFTIGYNTANGAVTFYGPALTVAPL